MQISHELWMESAIGGDLDEAEAMELLKISTCRTFEAGQTLFEEGDRAVAFFLIVGGEIDVVKKAPNGRMSVIATLTAPSVVGEMSLLTHTDRSAAARVRSARAAVLEVTWSDFETLLASHQTAAFKLVLAIARLLARRLKRINLKVVELGGGPDAANGEGQLQAFARFKRELFSDWSF